MNWGKETPMPRTAQPLVEVRITKFRRMPEMEAFGRFRRAYFAGVFHGNRTGSVVLLQDDQGISGSIAWGTGPGQVMMELGPEETTELWQRATGQMLPTAKA